MLKDRVCRGGLYIQMLSLSNTTNQSDEPLCSAIRNTVLDGMKKQGWLVEDLDDATKEQIMTNGFTPKKSKMYFLIKDLVMRPDEVLFEVDVGHAVNGAAHAGAMIESRWPRWRVCAKQSGEPDSMLPPDEEEDPVMKDWYDNSFRKVCCKVTREEFEYAKEYFPNTEWFAVTESAFGGAEIILVFKPRTEWPPFFKSLKLYS